MQIRGRRREEVGLDLTALIDVVFILVIFVVLAASFERLRELDVELPEADGAAPAPAGALVIVVFAQGGLTVDGREVAVEDLDAALAEAPDRSRPVQVQADASARVDVAVKVLDAVRKAGFETAGIATRAPSR